MLKKMPELGAPTCVDIFAQNVVTRSVASGGGGALPPSEEGGGPLLFDEGLDREYFDLTTVSTEEASAAIFRATTPPSAHHQVHCGGGGENASGDGVPGSYSNAADCPLAAFDIVNLGDDEFGFRLPDNTVVDSTGNQSHKGDSRTWFGIGLRNCAGTPMLFLGGNRRFPYT